MFGGISRTLSIWAKPFLLMTRTSRIFTAAEFAASTGGSTGLSSKQPDLFSELQAVKLSIVTAAIDRGFGSGLITPPLDLPASGRRHPIYVPFRVCMELCFW